MQVQIEFTQAFPAVFDTKDLTDAASVDGVIIGSLIQLSHSDEVHPDPKTGVGEFAAGLWCHIYGYDFRRRSDETNIVPLVSIGHVPLLSADALASVLEIKAGGQTILKRDPAYGLVDVQMLYTVATTYLDNSASMGMISVIGELHKYFTKENPDLSPDDITKRLAKEVGMPLEIVARAVQSAYARDAEMDDNEDNDSERGGAPRRLSDEAAALESPEDTTPLDDATTENTSVDDVDAQDTYKDDTDF